MTRYTTRLAKTAPQSADCDWWQCGPAYTQITVHETGDDMTPTGLLDRHGYEICRLRERMGFLGD